jgi:hypothetical protein
MDWKTTLKKNEFKYTSPKDAPIPNPDGATMTYRLLPTTVEPVDGYIRSFQGASWKGNPNRREWTGPILFEYEDKGGNEVLVIMNHSDVDYMIDTYDMLNPF